MNFKHIYIKKKNTFFIVTTDFLKTVGQDRQKCSRTDDFKIYIRLNVGPDQRFSGSL